MKYHKLPNGRDFIYDNRILTKVGLVGWDMATNETVDIDPEHEVEEPNFDYESNDQLKIVLETELGEVNASLTSSKHVYLSTDPPQTLQAYGGNWHIGIHLHCVDGVWDVKSKAEFHISSFDANLGKRIEKKIHDVLWPAWTDYINKHPELLRLAEIQDACNNLYRLESKIEDSKAMLLDQVKERKREYDRLKREFSTV